jgi:hypothetical protein
MEYACLLGQFVSYEEIEVLWIQTQMLSIDMLSVIYAVCPFMLSVIMPNVAMLTVLAPAYIVFKWVILLGYGQKPVIKSLMKLCLLPVDAIKLECFS